MKPRLAWVVPYLPAPVTSGGATRIVQLAQAVSLDFELHLFCRGEVWERGRLKEPRLSCFASTWMGRDYWPLGAGDLPRKLYRGSPRRLYSRIRAIHRRRPFAGLIVEHSWGARGACELGIPTLLDEHNIESAYLASWFEARGRTGRDERRQVAAMERWERELWAQPCQVTCVTREDAEAVGAYRATPAHVIPNGAALTKSTPRLPSERNGRILFVGAMHHPPNCDAARRLLMEVMPRVWQELPDAGVDVVGPSPPTELQALESARVRVHGAVPTVAPFLEEASVFACPLEAGAGSSLKTIEALGAGVPLVSTAVGARGFGLQPDVHFRLAETPGRMAEVIVDVLRNPDGATEMCRAGRRLAEPFDWQVLGTRFRRLVGELCEQAPEDASQQAGV